MNQNYLLNRTTQSFFRSVNSGKKMIMVLLISAGLFSVAAAQKQPATTPATRAAKPAADTSAKAIEEKLVALALAGPMYQGGEHQNKINELTLKAARNSWLNLLTVSANYNDQTFRKQDPNTAYVYPKFFTGLTIPIGTLFSRTGVKTARESVEISKINQEQLARNIRTNVLSKYKQYNNLSELISNQREVVDDYQAAYEQAKVKFSKDEITIELHNTASKNYNDEYAKLLDLQLQQDVVKLEIENMIGTDLNNVIRAKR